LSVRGPIVGSLSSNQKESVVTKPVLRTVLCDLLGIEYPIILAGMGPTVGGERLGVAGPELVAAVSNAGGLGVLGGAALPPDEMEATIRQIQELTNRPFGVDILLPANTARVSDAPVGEKPMRGEAGPSGDPRDRLPADRRAAMREIGESLGLPEARATLPPLDRIRFRAQDQVDVVVGMNVPVLATGLGSPGPYVDQVHASGGKVISLVGNVKNARRVAEVGADIVVAQGYDAGGHTGRIGSMALLPQALDAVSPTPVVAAGGIGDGRGIAAALAMGCAGVWCGTAFITTHEANLDEFRKRRILAASEEDTAITRLYSGKTMRNIQNDLIDAWEAADVAPLSMGPQGLLVSDVIEAAKQVGRADLLMNAAGQISGLATELRAASEVLEGMVAETAEILSQRLGANVEAAPAS